jgi:hypothetical protein
MFDFNKTEESFDTCTDMPQLRKLLEEASEGQLMEALDLINNKLPNFTNKVDSIDDYEYLYMDSNYYEIKHIDYTADDSSKLYYIDVEYSPTSDKMKPNYNILNAKSKKITIDYDLYKILNSIKVTDKEIGDHLIIIMIEVED